MVHVRRKSTQPPCHDTVCVNTKSINTHPTMNVKQGNGGGEIWNLRNSRRRFRDFSHGRSHADGLVRVTQCVTWERNEKHVKIVSRTAIYNQLVPLYARVILYSIRQQTPTNPRINCLMYLINYVMLPYNVNCQTACIQFMYNRHAYARVLYYYY